MLAGPSPGEVDVPDAVTELAQGRVLRVLWLNELGGLTFEIGSGDERCFLKWAPSGSGLDLSREAARLTWAGAFTRALGVLDAGENEAGSWLVTTPVPGETAVSDRSTLISAHSASLTVGRTSPSRHGAPGGTTDLDGSDPFSTNTASRPIPTALAIAACSGTSPERSATSGRPGLRGRCRPIVV